MEKLNELTKGIIAWAQDNPATVILMVATCVASYKLGEAIGESLVKMYESSSQS